MHDLTDSPGARREPRAQLISAEQSNVGSTDRGWISEHGEDLLGHYKSLGDYVGIVLRRAPLILGIFLVVALISVVYAFTRTPLYSSVAVVELETKKGKNDSKVYQTTEYDEFRSYHLTQQQILNSRSLAEALANRMNLADSLEFAPARPSLVARILGGLSSVVGWLTGSRERKNLPHGEEAQKIALTDQVRQRISVGPVKRSALVKVQMQAKDPNLAQQMLQNYLDLYLQRNLENRRRESMEAANWLKKEVEKSEKKLREAQAALVGFTIDHGLVDAADGGLQQVLNVLNKTMEGRVETHRATAKLQALQAQRSPDAGSLLPDKANNEYIGKLKQELAIMESEYSEMKEVYSNKFPKMNMLKKKIQFLRDRIGQIERNLVATALNTAKTEEHLLKRSYDQVKKEADRVKSLEAKYSLLKLAVSTNTEFYNILLKEYKQMEIKARTTGNNLRVVDAPSLPITPAKPNKALIVLIGSMLGLMGGIVAAFAVESVDRTVYNAQQIERDLNVRRLGIVPDATKLRRDEAVHTHNGNYGFLAYKFPKSAISDAVRNVETSIFLSAMDRRIRSLAVSSATPGEGKSLMSLSLSTVLASSGNKRVLLVDCDLRRPGVHAAFGLKDTGRGLTSLLEGKVNKGADVIRSSAIPNLFYLTAGPTPRNPVGLLRSDRMVRLTQELSRVFNYVIFDTPPVLGFSDTPVICRYVDGLVFVIRQGQPQMDEVKEAILAIRAIDHAKVLGVVLNKAQASWKYGYAYRNGAYYYRNYEYYSRGA